MSITWRDVAECDSDNAYIAVSKHAGLAFRQIFNLDIDSHYNDMKNVLLAAIRCDRSIIWKSLRIYDPPRPPLPGNTGNTLANFDMLIRIKNHTMDTVLVLKCSMIDGCPKKDRSLQYTILIRDVVLPNNYLFNSQVKDPRQAHAADPRETKPL